jgi:hypothetical protein
VAVGRNGEGTRVSQGIKRGKRKDSCAWHGHAGGHRRREGKGSMPPVLFSLGEDDKNHEELNYFFLQKYFRGKEDRTK